MFKFARLHITVMMALFGNCNVGLPYGPKFQTGDVIGCAVDNTNQRVFYTHNGKRIPGVAFDNFLNEEAYIRQ
uniref:B30.2/SPRY domain-containing protein n=1 Tax=Ditylenchus dipsaci TaxID=166011 RepID=A0A915DKH2_9BILA